MKKKIIYLSFLVLLGLILYLNTLAKYHVRYMGDENKEMNALYFLLYYLVAGIVFGGSLAAEVSLSKNLSKKFLIFCRIAYIILLPLPTILWWIPGIIPLELYPILFPIDPVLAEPITMSIVIGFFLLRLILSVIIKERDPDLNRTQIQE